MGDDHGDFVVAELLQADVHGVTVDDDVGGVDDDRRHLSELAQKAYELAALFTIMYARVVLVGLDFLDRKINDVKGVAHRNFSFVPACRMTFQWMQQKFRSSRGVLTNFATMDRTSESHSSHLSVRR